MQIAKSDLLEQTNCLRIFTGTATVKLAKLHLFLSLSAGCLISRNRLSCIILNLIYRYLQKFFKTDVLKNFAQFTGKHLSQSLFLISQWPASFLKRDFETVKSTIFTEHLESHAFVFMENICNIIKPNVNQPKWLFQPFETPKNIEMYTCEIKIT